MRSLRIKVSFCPPVPCSARYSVAPTAGVTVDLSTLVTQFLYVYESPLAAGATVWPHTDGRQTGRTFSVAVDRVRVSLFINSTRECSNGSVF